MVMTAAEYSLRQRKLSKQLTAKKSFHGRLEQKIGFQTIQLSKKVPQLKVVKVYDERRACRADVCRV